MRALITASFAMLASLWVTPPVFAQCEVGDEEALRWLEKMSHSLRETSYQGVFTYQHGGAVQSMRISHSVTGNVEQEQVTRLTGSGARVMRAEHPLDCVHPGHRLVRISQLYQNGDAGCGVAGYYQLKVAGRHRIAGREAVIINVLPRDIYRYGYQMALDRATGLLLKTQTVAQDGRVLERFQFADIEIGDVELDGTRVDLLHEAGHTHGAERPPAPTSTPAWNVAWLPSGFMPTDRVADTSYNKSFTDGLAIFSVFVENAPGLGEFGAGLARRGGTTAYTRGIQLSGRPILVTVLGEVPVNTARRVADSVVWSTQANAPAP